METTLEPLINDVHQGDCIAGMREMADQCVDLAFADPPFNIGYEYDQYDDQLKTEHYLQWSRDWISEMYRVLSDTGAFWLAIGDEYAAELKVEAQQIGFHTRSWVVWYYTFGVHCKAKFTRSHAHLFHFVKDPKKFVFNGPEVAVPSARQLVYGDKRANPTGRIPDDTWILRPQDCVDGFTADEDTWYFPRVAGTFKERAGFHGCQMPEQLLGRIIKSCSNPDDLVLDPFSGSCTTLTVAKKLGRRFVGFELSNDYTTLGRQRIESAHLDDPLEGSPEPQIGKTASESRERGNGKKASIGSQGFTNLTFDFSEITTEVDGLIEAFAQSNRGFSVDRVVADPILNADFQLQCDRSSVPGTPAERNRFLFRIRKSGKLKRAQIRTSHRTAFDWDHLDPFLYASEIAWRRTSELYAGVSLDEILCDPRLAETFDKIAGSLAQGYSELEFRWAALKLRKQTSQGRRQAEKLKPKALGLAKFKTKDLIPMTEFRIDDLAASPGVYAICQQDGSFLYAGESGNLRARLTRQLADGCWPSDQQDPSQIHLSVRQVPTISDARLARQSRLLKWHRPAWNFNDQISL